MGHTHALEFLLDMKSTFLAADPRVGSGATLGSASCLGIVGLVALGQEPPYLC